MNKTIPSWQYKTVLADFEVLVDANPTAGPPVAALKVNPATGKSYIMPMDLRAARDLALMLLDAVIKVSPTTVAELLK